MIEPREVIQTYVNHVTLFLDSSLMSPQISLKDSQSDWTSPTIVSRSPLSGTIQSVPTKYFLCLPSAYARSILSLSSTTALVLKLILRQSALSRPNAALFAWGCLRMWFDQVAQDDWTCFWPICLALLVSSWSTCCVRCTTSSDKLLWLLVEKTLLSVWCNLIQFGYDRELLWSWQKLSNNLFMYLKSGILWHFETNTKVVYPLCPEGDIKLMWAHEESWNMLHHVLFLKYLAEPFFPFTKITIVFQSFLKLRSCSTSLNNIYLHSSAYFDLPVPPLSSSPA